MASASANILNHSRVVRSTNQLIALSDITHLHATLQHPFDHATPSSPHGFPPASLFMARVTSQAVFRHVNEQPNAGCFRWKLHARNCRRCSKANDEQH